MHAISLTLALLAQTGPPPPAAALRFDWPRDLVASVETERTRERRGPTASARTMRASYRMRVSPHPEGLAISYDEFEMEALPRAEQNAIVDTLTAMSPDLIVGSDGSFQRIGDIASLRATVNEVFAPLLSGSDTPPGVKGFIDRFLTDEVLTGFAGQEWELLVGAWKDVPLSTDPVTVEVEAPSPMWPDVKIPMKLTGRLVERTACTRGGVSRECVVLEMRSTVDQAAMESLLKRMMQGLPVPDARYERLDVVTVSRIRLETQTMVPHELTTTKTVDMTVTVPKEGRTAARQIDRRTSRFSY